MTSDSAPNGAASEMDQARFLEDALINLSHELRTPLAAIKGYATSLMRHDSRLTGDERHAMLSEINRACDRLDEVIEQTTLTARVLQGQVTLQRQETDLVALTRQALLALDEAGATNYLLTLSGDAALLILADPRLLTHALLHLLDNARTYSPAGGEIHIAMRATSGSVGPMAEWSVTDHGIGIAPEHLPQIFTPFYRVENHLARSTNGLGLGLAFAQRVIALHGGELRVASEPGEGSRFWFALPLAGE